MRTCWRMLLIAPLAACGGGGDDGPAPATRDYLADPHVFAFEPAESVTTLYVSLDRGPTTETAEVALEVTGGQVTLSADGDRLAVDDLTLELGDIAMPLDVFPTPTILAGVHVHLQTPMSLDATWTADGESAVVRGPGVLMVDWSFQVGERIYPLGSQPMNGLSFTVEAAHVGDRLRARLHAIAHGAMWTWADIVMFGDLDLDAAGYAPAE